MLIIFFIYRIKNQLYNLITAITFINLTNSEVIVFNNRDDNFTFKYTSNFTFFSLLSQLQIKFPEEEVCQNLYSSTFLLNEQEVKLSEYYNKITDVMIHRNGMLGQSVLQYKFKASLSDSDIFIPKDLFSTEKEVIEFMQEIKDERYNVETFGNEDARNNTPFDFALSQENNNLAKALIFMGADKEEALIRSAIRGNLELVQFLLDHGADINAKNKEGSTALINAVFVQDSEVVK